MRTEKYPKMIFNRFYNWNQNIFLFSNAFWKSKSTKVVLRRKAGQTDYKRLKVKRESLATGIIIWQHATQSLPCSVFVFGNVCRLRKYASKFSISWSSWSGGPLWCGNWLTDCSSNQTAIKILIFFHVLWSHFDINLSLLTWMSIRFTNPCHLSNCRQWSFRLPFLFGLNVILNETNTKCVVPTLYLSFAWWQTCICARTHKRADLFD